MSGGHRITGKESWADMSEAESDWRVVDFADGGVKGAGIARSAESSSGQF